MERRTLIWMLAGGWLGGLIIALILIQEWINKPPTNLQTSLIFSAVYIVIAIIISTIIGYIAKSIIFITKKRSLIVMGILGMLLSPFLVLEILELKKGETLNLNEHVKLFITIFSLYPNFIFLPFYIAGLILGSVVGYIIDNGISAFLRIRKWKLGAMIGFTIGLVALPGLFLFSSSKQQFTSTGAGMTFAFIYFFIQIIVPLLFMICGVLIGALIDWLVGHRIKKKKE